MEIDCSRDSYININNNLHCNFKYGVKMKNEFGVIFGVTSSIAMACAFLWHFSNILRFGDHLIKEPNIFILLSEIILITGILIIGLITLIKCLKVINDKASMAKH